MHMDKESLIIIKNEINEIAGLQTGRLFVVCDTAFLHDIKKLAGKNVYYLRNSSQDNVLDENVIEWDELFFCAGIDDLYYVLSENNAFYFKGELLDYGINDNQIVLSSLCRSGASTRNECYDILLGYTREQDVLGFKIYGDPDSEALKIVTLGGSTTDSTFNNVCSWPEILHQKLNDMGCRNVLYNGGMAGYKVSQELIKLIRDALLFKPDIVISLSGTNNAWDKHWVQNTKFSPSYQALPLEYAREHNALVDVVTGHRISKICFGIENHESLAEFWTNCERMMHSICAEFGIKFFGFLQPVKGYLPHGVSTNTTSLSDKDFFDRIHFFDEAREIITNYDYMTDLTALFEEKQYIFTDVCHVLKQGNQAIADAILRKII